MISLRGILYKENKRKYNLSKIAKIKRYNNLFYKENYWKSDTYILILKKKKKKWIKTTKKKIL
jgi:hypothetical protein